MPIPKLPVNYFYCNSLHTISNGDYYFISNGFQKGWMEVSPVNSFYGVSFRLARKKTPCLYICSPRKSISIPSTSGYILRSEDGRIRIVNKFPKPSKFSAELVLAKQEELVRKAAEKQAEINNKISIINDENYILTHYKKYYFHYPDDANWVLLTHYDGNTIKYVRSRHNHIIIGELPPRFKTEKPYPHGY